MAVTHPTGGRARGGAEMARGKANELNNGNTTTAEKLPHLNLRIVEYAPSPSKAVENGPLGEPEGQSQLLWWSSPWV